MNRLIVNPGTPNAWEISLKPGLNSLGRGEGNDFSVEHESISSSHCQVVVTGSGARIKDLGSVNGTFVDGALVEEAVLLSGQTIRLGDIEMRFEADVATPAPVVRVTGGSPAAAQSPPTPPLAAAAPGPVPVSSEAFCAFHPRARARFACPKCRRTFCDLCVNTRPDGGVPRKFCRACGAECVPLHVPLARPEAPAGFFAQLPGAFSYPMRGDGVVLLVAGALFYSLLHAAMYLARFAPIYGLVAVAFLTIFGGGYLTSYLRRILTSSAMGEDTMPDWPEITDFSSDVLLPLFQLLGTLLACFAPAIALMIFVARGHPGAGWTVVAGIIFGCVYFPMAFLAVAMFDTVTAVNPLLVVPSMLKIPLEYLVTLGLLAAVLLVRWAGDLLLPQLLPVPVVSVVLANCLGLYLLTVEMRILGILCRARQDELGWFNR